jgi:hypothetical protein
MRQVGFEPRSRVFQRVNAVQALDRAATVIGVKYTGGGGGTLGSSTLAFDISICKKN